MVTGESPAVRVAEIQKVVEETFDANDRAALRAWLDEYEAQIADQHFENAVLAGNFDGLIEKAKEDIRAGRTTDLTL